MSLMDLWPNMASYRDAVQEDPLHRRPLTRLARKERELLRRSESTIDQHRRLGQELINTVCSVRQMILAMGRRLAH